MKVLNLSHNSLTRFEAEWQYNWLGLQVLDLSYNQFSGRMFTSELNFIKFDPGKFYVNLSYNNIEQIVAQEVFPGENENLVSLNIAGNPVASDCDSVLAENHPVTLTGFQSSCRVNQDYVVVVMMMVVTLFVVLSLTVSLIFVSLKRRRCLETSCCLVHSRSAQKNKEFSSLKNI